MSMKDKLIELIKESVGGCATYWASWASHIAAHLIANDVTVQQWIPVSERLPEPEQNVLTFCRTPVGRFRYQCIAVYVPSKWLREQSKLYWDYECCDEYDEEADDYYVNAGWYERIHNWDDYGAVGIVDEVTHWMPLPSTEGLE